MENSLSNLLKSGMTPEEIFKEATKLSQEMKDQEAKAKAKNDQITRARTDLVKALDLYSFAVCGKHLGEEIAKEFEASLKTIEKMMSNSKGRISSKEDIDKLFEELFML